MRLFYDVFKEDPASENGSIALKELSDEYFIVSVYILLRHLRKLYVFDAAERQLFRDFVLELQPRLRDNRESDTDLLVLSDSRQQTARELEKRHQILRQLFFDHAKQSGHEMLTKDERRAFSEAERIFVYRRDNGLCQLCLKEDKPEAEARVPWREYDADHVIAHAKGGPTDVANAQVLCRYHNRHKGTKGA